MQARTRAHKHLRMQTTTRVLLQEQDSYNNSINVLEAQTCAKYQRAQMPTSEARNCCGVVVAVAVVAVAALPRARLGALHR